MPLIEQVQAECGATETARSICELAMTPGPHSVRKRFALFAPDEQEAMLFSTVPQIVSEPQLRHRVLKLLRMPGLQTEQEAARRLIAQRARTNVRVLDVVLAGCFSGELRSGSLAPLARELAVRLGLPCSTSSQSEAEPSDATAETAEDPLQILADAADPLPHVAAFRSAIGHLVQSFGPFATLRFLICLRDQLGPSWLARLSAVMAERATSATPAPTKEVPPALPGRTAAEQVPEPGLTALHRTIFAGLLSAARAELGAMPPETLRELVVDARRSNRNFTTIGYVQGACDAALKTFDAPPRSAPRAEGQWYHLGYIAMLDALRRDRNIDEHAGTCPTCRGLCHASREMAQEAFPVLAASWSRTHRLDLIADHLKPTGGGRESETIEQLLEYATSELDGGATGRARMVFGALERFLPDADSRDASAMRLRRTVARRLAATFRLAGTIPEAERRIRSVLADEPDPALRAMLLVDLGLMAAGLRQLSDLRLPFDENDAFRMGRQLHAALPHLEEALREDPGGAAHAHYVNGMRSLCSLDFVAAAAQLERAVEAFRGNLTYRRRGLRGQAEEQHALAELAAQRTETRMRSAIELLRNDPAQDGIAIPTWLMRAIAESAASGSAGLRELIVEWLVEVAGDVAVTECLKHPELHGAVVARQLLRRAVVSGYGADAQSQDAEQGIRMAMMYLPTDVRARDLVLDDVQGAMDAWHRAVSEDADPTTYVRALSERALLSPLADLADRENRRALIHEARGEFGAALGVRTGTINRLLASLNPEDYWDVEPILDRIKSYPAEAVADATTGLEQRWRARATLLEAPAPPERYQGRVRLLVVGGSEMQQRVHDVVRKRVKERAPWIEIEFVPTAWSANWSRFREHVRTKLASGQADGLVMHYFIRTTFGRRTRELAEHWGSVHGHGVEGVTRGVLALGQKIASAKGSGRY